MNHAEQTIILQTILIALTVILYLKKWGELLQFRQQAIYVVVPLLWSCIFMYLLLKTYPQPMILGTIGVIACYYWIGMLLFPSLERFDAQNKFAYLDYYEHFRKQIPWIMGLALIALLLPPLLPQNKVYSVSDYLLISFFGLAFFTEHKGLMCVLAWGTILVLFSI